ncbi:MAG TPA: MBL fold metallo-hydrolase, partial [Gemmatimonadales bacterium]|nr:MBL fold metallo-hydrolase [Gemmatimonadales bacterium]
MIRLVVLGSGSKGNAIAISAGDATLLVDAGFSGREIRRRAASSGVSLERVVGIALTHEHGDHATGAPLLARDLGAPIACSPGTWDRLRSRAGKADHLPLSMTRITEAGPFRIESAGTSHDATEPLALAVSVGGVSIGVAYDLGRPTAAVRYLLRGRTALVLEANHDDVLLRTSGYPAVVQQRIAGAGGHLSNRVAAELLGELVHPGLEVVVLAHLSERCNTERHARDAVTPVLAAAQFGGALHVAQQSEPSGPFLLRSG